MYKLDIFKTLNEFFKRIYFIGYCILVDKSY